MILDLRPDHPFPADIRPLFLALSGEVKEDFNAMVENMSAQKGHALSWQLTAPASRDSRVSSLYHHCICLALLRHLEADTGELSEIVTDSSAMAVIIRGWAAEHAKQATIRIHEPRNGETIAERVSRTVRDILDPIRYGFAFRKHIRSKAKRPVLPDAALTLIDTFVVPGFIEKDRYYGEMEALTPEGDAIWEAPR